MVGAVLAESLLNVVGAQALVADPAGDARVEEVGAEVLVDGVLAGHVGVGVAHALDDERCHDGHAEAVVVDVLLQGGHGVVGSVAADGACQPQVVGQGCPSVDALLQVAVGGHGHGAALRVAHDDGPVVIAERAAALLQELLAGGHDAVDDLSRRGLLVEVGMGAVHGGTIALVVGEDDEAP